MRWSRSEEALRKLHEARKDRLIKALERAEVTLNKSKAEHDAAFQAVQAVVTNFGGNELNMKEKDLLKEKKALLKIVQEQEDAAAKRWKEVSAAENELEGLQK